MERRYFEGEIWNAAGELWKMCGSTTEITQTNAGELRKNAGESDHQNPVPHACTHTRPHTGVNGWVFFV